MLGLAPVRPDHLVVLSSVPKGRTDSRASARNISLIHLSRGPGAELADTRRGSELRSERGVQLRGRRRGRRQVAARSLVLRKSGGFRPLRRSVGE